MQVRKVTFHFLVACGLLNLCGMSVALGQTQTDMTKAADRDAQKVEQRLDAAINKYRKRLDKTQLRDFDESQRLWVAYRKSACDFEAGGDDGGSVQPMIILECFQRYAAVRLMDVQRLLTCTEGDLSCPVFSDGT